MHPARAPMDKSIETLTLKADAWRLIASRALDTLRAVHEGSVSKNWSVGMEKSLRKRADAEWIDQNKQTLSEIGRYRNDDVFVTSRDTNDR